MASPGTSSARALSGGTLVLAGFVVATVAMMIVPLPTALLDVLLTVNLGLAVCLLLAAAFAARGLELSTFPTLLVLTTLFRLALNISTVRLILLQANAGRVVSAFGGFVVRGDYVVGLALFLILALVQYVVIARGAERVAEVAARFSLDALPGAQLAIDAEVRAGHIDAAEARARRGALEREAQLYGSLDGAMRFVKGDAIAALIILALSLVGGLLIGVVRNGLPLGEAARVYTLLTVGDGLVTQLPALLIATAAGLVVTRAASDREASGLGPAVAAQLGRPRALAATAVLLALLALVPGLPLWPFAAVAVSTGALALWARRRAAAHPPVALSLPRETPALEVAVAPQLAPLLAALSERAQTACARVADELGVVVPAAELRVDAQLPVRGWAVRLRGLQRAAGRVPDGRLLAEVGPAALPAEIAGEATEHPATGALASWVPASARERLIAAGIPLLDDTDVLAVALERVLRRAPAELLGIDETARLVDGLAERRPALVRELATRRLDVAQVADLLRALVAEGVPVRELDDVLEALLRAGDAPADERVERIRALLHRRISARFAPAGTVEAIALDPDAEEMLRSALRASGEGIALALEPELADGLSASVRRARDEHPAAVVLAPADLRRHVRRLLQAEHPDLAVLTYAELDPEVTVERVGSLRPI